MILTVYVNKDIRSTWIKWPRRSPCVSDRTDTGWPDLGPAAPPRLLCCLLCTVCTVHTAEHCTSDRLIQTDLVWPRALFHQREEDSRGFLRNYFVRSRYIMKWVLGLRFLHFWHNRYSEKVSISILRNSRYPSCPRPGNGLNFTQSVHESHV